MADEFNPVSTLQNLVNAGLNDRISKHAEREAILVQQRVQAEIGNANKSRELNEANQGMEFWRESANHARKKVKQLEEEVEFYKNLLSKPMAEIASKNENFKETYRVQQELLANWMVSQKAFKELAIDLGLELGKEKEEIIDEGFKNKQKVLNNQTKHDNNAIDSSIIRPHIETLKNKK